MKNEASQFFDRFAVTFDSFYDGKRNIFMQKIDQRFRRDIFERFTRTFNSIDDISIRSILDVGCGSGVYMFEALKQGAKFVTGVDAAPKMLELASSFLSSHDNFKGRYKLVEGNFPQIEIEEHDYAIVMGVLDYIENPLDFLMKLREKTKIAAIISFPSIHWFRTPIRKFRYKLRSCPVYFYDENKITELGSRAGFNKIRIEKIEGAGLDFHVFLACE